MYIILVIIGLLFGCEEKTSVTFKPVPEEKKVDVYINQEFFTSYIYNDTLKKPVLYPIFSENGTSITRGYPIDPKPHERMDHPHHIGHWFNYGNVNGFDFWNNSFVVSDESKHKYGKVLHHEIIGMKSGTSSGRLQVRCLWITETGEKLLGEETTFTFVADKNARSIVRKTTLKAVNKKVVFKDNKEGMFALRMSREFEFPTKKPLNLTDETGKKSSEKRVYNKGRKGSYISSNGIKDKKVWGTRAGWVSLSSEVNNKKTAVTIMDHPSNPGYPTYWHARPYGLFSANPLGQKVFSNGKNILNLSLNKNESKTFLYQIFISTGELNEIEKQFEAFTAQDVDSF